MNPDRVWLVRNSGDLDPVAETLGSRGYSVHDLTPGRNLPRGGPKKTYKSFKHTPEALLDSWRMARAVDATAGRGDWVIFGDSGGLGGVFALEESGKPPTERRRVVVFAGDSMTLEELVTVGTLESAPDPYAVDWEMVAFRFAEKVWSASERATAELARIGVEATRFPVGTHPVRLFDPGPNRIRLHEAPARKAQTGPILRALSGYLDQKPGLRIAVADSDVEDRFWKGSAWEALAGTRRLIEDHLDSQVGFEADLTVVGDPLAMPGPALVAKVEAGSPVVVPEGSAASTVFPDAPTWRDEDSLVEALNNPTRPVRRTDAEFEVAVRLPAFAGDRARRVSVGIPVHRDVRHLDACLMSVFSQSQAPFEVMIMDDGSRSSEVDRALEKWAGRARIMSQPNRGVCVARNRMLEQMQGDAFVFLDSDDILDSEFVAATATTLRSNPGLSAVATWTEFFGEYQGIEAKPPFDSRVGRRENSIVSTCVLVDMQVRDWGVRFAPDLAFLYCEDWDFWAQIVGLGGRFGLVPRPLARHRVHETSGGFNRTDAALVAGRARAVAHLPAV